MTFFVLCFPV